LDAEVCSLSRLFLGLNPGGPAAGSGHNLRSTACSSTTPTPTTYAFTSATVPGCPATERGATWPSRTTASGRVGPSPPPQLLAAHAAGRGAARSGPVLLRLGECWANSASVPALRRGSAGLSGSLPLDPGPWAATRATRWIVGTYRHREPGANRRGSYGGAYCRARTAAYGSSGAPTLWGRRACPA
jgi:hypothetical protein